MYLLPNKGPLRWVIRSGKAKDEADSMALATRAFRAGPLLVLARDTATKGWVELVR